MELDEKPCRIPELVQDIQNMVHAEVLEKNLTVEVDLERLVHPEVCCDSLRMNQVLLNLLSNAVRYTEAGGKVTMVVSETPGVSPGSANFEFCITDTGIGMTKEFVEHIFEPFERENTTTLSGVAGTGLGMAITKNIVDMMNGFIEVESEKGEGTKITVSFTFDLCREDKAKEPEESAGEEGALGFAGPDGCQILLVEDNELNQEIAVSILEEAGLLVDVASNGQIAVEMLEKAGPGYYRLILMDVQMPVMNGYEAARAIRALGRADGEHIPIIAMTANAFAEDVRDALEAGMNAHVAKPIDMRLLKEAMDHIEREE